MRRQAFLPTGVGLDLAVLLVTIPRWTRLNVTVTRPDAPTHQPVTNALIVLGALSRLGLPYGSRIAHVQPRVAA